MKSKKTNRRKFIAKSFVALSGTMVLPSCSNKKINNNYKETNINFNKKYKWKMTTTWSPNMPVLGEGCNLLSKWIYKMSGGRLDIKVYGGGEFTLAIDVDSADLEPSNSGGVALECGIEPQLPSGLSFNNSSGAITGIDTEEAAPVNYTIFANNSGGTGLGEIMISVIDITPLSLIHI